MGVEAGDFDGLYRGQHRRVVAVLVAVCGEPDLARDAADEAFARAYDRWDRVARMEAPAGWVYRVALNVLRRSLRRRALEMRLLHRQYLPAEDVVPHPEVWAAVRSLPVRQRTAIGLRFVADLAEADIAAVMGVSRGTVSSTLADARGRLAELLADEAPAEVVP